MTTPEFHNIKFYLLLNLNVKQKTPDKNENFTVDEFALIFDIFR